jgi:hypothetical protein
LRAELQYLPCSTRCANWLRYGIQPDHPGPGLIPGRCPSKAHDREHLGGGRRVLVSRDWSGKTLSQHKADRATVVREALLSAGIVAPEVERMAADVLSADGMPRFIWTDDTPDPSTYAQVILASIAERQRWRAQYEQAKDQLAAAAGAVDNCSASGAGPPTFGAAHSSASPDDQPKPGPQERQSRVSAANPKDAEGALDCRAEGRTLPDRGRPSPQPPTEARR